MTALRVLERARGVAGAAILALSLVAATERTARADGSGNGAAAQALFDEGKKQMAAGHYDRACASFEQSQKLDPAVGTLLNLANCYEKAGKTASAWTTWVEVQSVAVRAGRADAERVAKERADALVKRLSKLTISAASADKQPGLEVTRDGVTVGTAELGLPIPVDPGPHTIAAKAPGRKSRETRITVTSGTEPRVVVPELGPEPTADAPAVAPVPRKPEEPPPPAASEPQPSSPSHTRRTVGLVVGGFGVVAAAAGGVFAVLTKNKDNAADKLCTGGDGNACSDKNEKTKYDETVSTAKTFRTLSIISFGVGAAALATGAVLVFGGSSGVENASLSLTPVAGPGEAGFIARGRF
jgi:hypothetical protein